jgi:hypothetical protein
MSVAKSGVNLTAARRISLPLNPGYSLDAISHIATRIPALRAVRAIVRF